MNALVKISVLLVFLLCACNFPSPGEPPPGPTPLPDAAPAPVTEPPAQDGSSTDCAFVWARQPLADLSLEFDESIKGTLPQASGSAEAYGENCINAQGEVVRFLAMETDYYVTLTVDDLKDKQALGEAIAKVLQVLANFPVGETPGPQPGYVGITFETSAEELRLWFTRRDAEAALENGLRGEELFNALQAK